MKKEIVVCMDKKFQKGVIYYLRRNGISFKVMKTHRIMGRRLMVRFTSLPQWSKFRAWYDLYYDLNILRMMEEKGDTDNVFYRDFQNGVIPFSG